MIKTVAEMLESFLAKEKAVLSSSKVTHTTTIGTMWENVSQKLLEQALPRVDLTVGSGFVEHSSGKLGKELDCVLAIGAGRKLPYTDKLLYKPEQLVAIVQVKKTLYTKDLDGGFKNLRDILNFDIQPPPNISVTVRRSFQIIANVPLPDDISMLMPHFKGLYHMLVCEAMNPCRIFLGYYGFKSEETFRQGIVDHLTSLATQKGWGPPSMPGYIIGNGFAAIKNTAMPFGFRMVDEWMPLYTTTSAISPLEILVEAIWSRLNYMGMTDYSLFGEDLRREAFNQLIDAKPISETHWEISTRGAQLPEDDGPDEIDWEPCFVSEKAFILANMLCKKFPNPVSLKALVRDPELVASIGELEEQGIAARSVENPDLAELLTVQCGCLICPDGQYAVGENDSGRLMRWMQRYIQSRREMRKS